MSGNPAVHCQGTQSQMPLKSHVGKTPSPKPHWFQHSKRLSSYCTPPVFLDLQARYAVPAPPEEWALLPAQLYLAPRCRQCTRPVIIKCNTGQRSPSTPMAIPLPIRRSSRTVWPSTSVIDGSAVRSRKGFVNCVCWIGCAMIPGSSAWIKATISGSWGITLASPFCGV